MPVETEHAGLYYCEKCHRTKSEKEFYGSNNLEKYPNGKLNICKSCISMHVDNWDPDTYLWILQEADVPYVPKEWAALMQKYAKDKSKLTGSTILGRYLAKMKLRQFKSYRWADTEFLQQLEDNKIEVAMKQSKNNYSASDITKAIMESNTIEYPEKPIAEDKVADLSFIYEEPEDEEDEDVAKNLTKEDRTYLRIKWGSSYKPEEWIQLEKLYSDMMNSYDIQTAGHIDTLKLICKTSLKANQLLDLGDKTSCSHKTLLIAGKSY